MASADDFFAILGRGGNPLEGASEDILASILEENEPPPSLMNLYGLLDYPGQPSTEDLKGSLGPAIEKLITRSVRTESVPGRFEDLQRESKGPVKASEGQSAFSLGPTDTFENTKGSFSRTPTGTSERAYTNFSNFLKDVSKQRRANILSKANMLAERAATSGDAKSAAAASELLKSVAFADQADSENGDGLSTLQGLKTMEQIGEIKDRRGQNARKPIQDVLKKFAELGVTGRNLAALEEYAARTPGLDPVSLWAFARQNKIIPEGFASRKGTELSEEALSQLFSFEDE